MIKSADQQIWHELHPRCATSARVKSATFVIGLYNRMAIQGKEQMQRNRRVNQIIWFHPKAEDTCDNFIEGLSLFSFIVRALNAQSNEGSFHSRHSNDDPQHLPTED
jgi:hypothetical protein